MLMSDSSLKYGTSLHKDYPRTCAAKDFWGQVCRTVDGKPVSQEQIDMIKAQIDAQLCFEKTDTLLDIGCGNGALASLFFSSMKAYLGVDFSEYLIKVGLDNFSKDGFDFIESDAVKFTAEHNDATVFSKALCYGAFSYFSDEMAKSILYNLSTRFTGISRLFIGNLPDRDLADVFYRNNDLKEKYLDDPQSSIGHWRTSSSFTALCNDCGWDCEIVRMPKGFYSSHYRYDALLTRS